jgi:hypothetical protein
VALPASPASDAGPVPRRAALAFFAGALLLVMLSMHLRWLLARTAEAGAPPPWRAER